MLGLIKHPFIYMYKYIKYMKFIFEQFRFTWFNADSVNTGATAVRHTLTINLLANER